MWWILADDLATELYAPPPSHTHTHTRARAHLSGSPSRRLLNPCTRSALCLCSGMSVMNLFEVRQAWQWTCYFLCRGVRPQSITILTPYKGQCMELRKRFRVLEGSVSIQTVDRSELWVCERMAAGARAGASSKNQVVCHR